MELVLGEVQNNAKGHCRGGAGDPARRVHVRQAPEPGPDAGALPVVPEDLRAGPKLLEAQGHYAQRALLQRGGKAGRGAREPAGAKGPGGPPLQFCRPLSPRATNGTNDPRFQPCISRAPPPPTIFSVWAGRTGK